MSHLTIDYETDDLLFVWSSDDNQALYTFIDDNLLSPQVLFMVDNLLNLSIGMKMKIVSIICLPKINPNYKYKNKNFA